MSTLTKKRENPAGRASRSRNLLSILALVVGALLLLYPVVSTLATHYTQMRQNEVYSGAVADLTDDAKARELARAHEYNDWLLATGPHARPARAGDEGLDYYLSQLSLPENFQVIARIRIPAINVDLPVFHTTNPGVLYDGAGHMYGSSLPVGGEGNNAVISAHTGMVNAAMFDQLPQLRSGDDIFIDIMGQRLRYVMVDREVAGPHDYEAVTYEPGKDKLTLITCTPYGLNTDRLLVHAERAPLLDDSEPEISAFVWSWWMIAVVVIVCVVFLLILWKWLRRAKVQ